MNKISYYGREYPLRNQAELVKLLGVMGRDVSAMGADVVKTVERVDTHQAVLQNVAGGGNSSVAALALLRPGAVALPGVPTTGPGSGAQIQESDAPTVGTQVIVDLQTNPPTVEAIASGGSLGTSGTIAIGTTNTAQKMSDTAHVIALTLGSSGANGTVGYLTTVKSGKPYPIGRIPIVNVGQNKLGIRTQQSQVAQDVNGYIHYPLFIPGTLITGTDEIPVTMIA